MLLWILTVLRLQGVFPPRWSYFSRLFEPSVSLILSCPDSELKRPEVSGKGDWPGTSWLIEPYITEDSFPAEHHQVSVKMECGGLWPVCLCSSSHKLGLWLHLPFIRARVLSLLRWRQQCSDYSELSLCHGNTHRGGKLWQCANYDIFSVSIVPASAGGISRVACAYACSHTVINLEKGRENDHLYDHPFN